MQNRDDELANLLNLYFLGPKAEQRSFFIETLELAIHDFIFWRRNFHPQDPPPIPYRHLTSDIANQYKDNFMQKFFTLLGELKLDIPNFSPRYMAHMTSEVSLPALLAHITTSLYNPNNLTGETAPVTIKYESRVRAMMANMMGFVPEDVYGNFTSGGTLANYQSLYYNQIGRTFPLTLAMTLKEKKMAWPKSWPQTTEEWLDFPLENITDLLKTSPLEMQEFQALGIGQLGQMEFWNRARSVFQSPHLAPAVIMPPTTHYSWYKAMGLLGLGKQQVLKVAVRDQFELDPNDLAKVVQKAKAEHKLIIQLVTVFGSTEFGHFDPLDEIVALKKKHGWNFPIHVDGAYGGHFPSMFIKGELFPEMAVKSQSQYQQLYDRSMALKDCDSITIDPHKMGLVPYAAGFFITRHRELRHLVAEKATYVFDSLCSDDEKIGQYILEGSRPGTQAAATYFSYQVIPLNSDGLGTIAWRWCEQAKFLENVLKNYQHPEIQFVCLHERQSNILCFLSTFMSDQKQNKKLKVSNINAASEFVFNQFCPQNVKSVQYYSYFLSKTSVTRAVLLPSLADQFEWDVEVMICLRAVIMNMWSDRPVTEAPSAIEGLVGEIASLTLKQREEN